MSMSFMPSGNIIPSRAVKHDSSQTAGYILQAGAGDRAIGISQTGTRQPPIVGFDDGYAGIQNINAVEVLTQDDEGWCEIGGAVSFGDYLKPSTNGVLITASADGDQYCCVALQSGTASGQLIKMKVQIGFRGA